MSRKFSAQRPQVGGTLPHNAYGRLVGDFQFSSHVPQRGGKDTRAIFI